MSSFTKESLLKSTLNKRSKVPSEFHALFDKATIPFPSFEFALLGKRELTHYSLHNWDLVSNLTPPTICLHGLNGSRLLFSDLVSVVERHYPHIPLLVIDLYGHGLSSCPSKKYNLDLFVTQIEKLLKYLDVAPTSMVNIIGFSLGGAVAVGFARKFPRRIEKLVLIAPAGFVPIAASKQPASSSDILGSDDGSTPAPGLGGISSQVKLVKWIPAFILTPIMKSIFKKHFATAPQLELPAGVPDHIKREHGAQMERLMWQSFIKKGTFSATISIVKHFPLFNMEKEYTAVLNSVVGQERPVLLIWGDEDRVSPLWYSGEKVRKYFRNSFLLKVEDAGHVVLAEQPSIVFSSILSFLQSPSDFRFYPPGSC
jgi:pimeloyl-ACP methyl ester carboxylesterase